MAAEDKTVLCVEDILADVANLEGWEYLSETSELCRVWHFEKFVPTMELVRYLTNVMDENNHHCDLQLDSRSKTLMVRVTTHSENAVTRADIDFAKAVNASS